MMLLLSALAGTASVLSLESASVIVDCGSLIALRGASPGSKVTLYSAPEAGEVKCSSKSETACLELKEPITALESSAADDSGTTQFKYISSAEETLYLQAEESTREGLRLSNVATLTSNPQLGDSDGDGLTNLQECYLGTDPFNWDTDGDGWGDGEEQNLLGSNPLEVRIGLEADIGCDGTWPSVGALLSMANTVESAYGPLIGIDIQSWSLLETQYHSNVTVDCGETPVMAVE